MIPLVAVVTVVLAVTVVIAIEVQAMSAADQEQAPWKSRRSERQKKRRKRGSEQQGGEGSDEERVSLQRPAFQSFLHVREAEKGDLLLAES